MLPAFFVYKGVKYLYYNGNKKYRVATFMNQVHQVAAARYLKVNQQDVENAAKLQTFFQNLKQAAANPEGNDNEAISIILDTIQLRNGEKLKNLFRQAQGSRSGLTFENELMAVIEAVFKNLTDDDIQINEISFGQKAANLTIKDFTSDLAQKTLKAAGTKTVKELKNEKKGRTQKQYYLQSVEGKIDVKGYSINIKEDPNPKLLEIYELLKDATFSAKNYKSKNWQGIDLGYKEITLGKTNVVRSVVGALTGLGYDQRTAESALWAGLNKIKDGDIEVANHMYHLRYMYELSGIGLLYGEENYGDVKYLIYNDPTGNIYVKATSEILLDILETKISLNQALSTIKIPKSKFLED